ncbi:inactive TPR repeat-containing thioredoxin TTL3-like [Rhodamnia argentea]|uniref:Inactive TPR repeat-containing thioredoxin TTL3-like n=1 Tax=Rhodamnia argentea TaxID=178133 RepID=A0A8B8PWA7_9MYRT|nr:inactive TPR repeat-containing thioredoxin TTL3-like [Rhodamnia argentea]XP_030538546.1 inactive TPR repeat-containing thioredoxin TTL3-like [Rhodamnia argentea]
MSSAGKAAGDGTGVDSLAARFAGSASCEVNKPDYRELDLGSPVSPLTARKSIGGGATTTVTTSSSSSSSSGSVSGKTSANASSDAETLQSAPSRTPRRGHRRSASAGAPLIHSSRSLTPNSSASGSSITSSNHHANVVGLSGNICPSGKISKPNLTNANGNRMATLSSGSGNYGHGSIMRGGASTPKTSNGSVAETTTGKSVGESVVKRGMASLDPEDVKNAGNELYRKGKFEDALLLYDRAIAISPDNASYRSNRAAALTALGRLGEAVTECEEAVRLEPGHGRARQRLASLYLRLGQVENARHHLCYPGQQPDPCELSKLQSLEKHLNLCIESRKIGDWKNAVKESDAVMEAGAKSSPLVLACKAEALLKLHKLQDAETSLKAISNLPFYSQSKFCGMFAEAYVLYVQSQVDMAMGRFDNAVAAVEKAGRIDYSNADIALLLSNVKMVANARARGHDLFNSGRFDEAIAAYGEGLKYDNCNSVLYCNRAVCWSKLGLWDKSIEDCNQALMIQPYYTKALLRRAVSNGKLGRWEEAIRDYEVLRRERPGDSEIAESLRRARVALMGSQHECRNLKPGLN